MPLSTRATMDRASFIALTAAALTTPARAAVPAPVSLGDDLFISERWRDLRGRTIGIVTNQSGVLSTGEPLIDAAHRNPDITIGALFGPEHGIRGTVGAGAAVASSTDAQTGLPVYSLYGATRHPTAEMLADIDVLLFDIQDVGDRAYTYISTMAYIMQSAREFGKEVWILDRPNPIGGLVVEGPVLDPKFSSFIGLYPIAMRHGLTVGELALLFNDRFGIGCNLRVIAMQNYERWMLWPDTGLDWIPTSPNIPTWQTTLVYPGTGLISEAGINNGTGDVEPFRPFFFAGAYTLDGEQLAAALNARRLLGVRFRPAAWRPQSGFWSGKTLTGVELILTDPRSFRAVLTAVEILIAVRTIAPRFLSIDAQHLDRDWGTDSLRLGLTNGLDADAIEAQWADDVGDFERLRQRYFLYPS
ncbi:MAG TPA: DUF1343 domain-containing protein [Candidatus Acidoferrales bacterium]|nr:DUF1343 domain-containing protein [Candidatus Acidoferrales bacterium]